MTRRRDHPRIRGEHIRRRSYPCYTPGSSPHTRGARASPSRRCFAPRIIPAYAGSTATQRYLFGAIGDHPRIRGEHLRQGSHRSVPAGSSPHTRGALGGVSQAVVSAGIIPAYAGSTTVAQSASGHGSDHPRIRGEHDVYDMVTARGRGSSPHTRGAPATMLTT